MSTKSSYEQNIEEDKINENQQKPKPKVEKRPPTKMEQDRESNWENCKRHLNLKWKKIHKQKSEKIQENRHSSLRTPTQTPHPYGSLYHPEIFRVGKRIIWWISKP